VSIDIGLSGESRRGVVTLLALLLADEFVLYTKTRNFHWNVTGPQFNDLHKFFETQYEEVDGFVDDVAERIRTLGYASPGSLAEFLSSARLTETGVPPDARGMISDLLADHQSIVRSLRADLAACQDAFGDAGTSDFLTGLMEKHEKMCWMLRSFL